MPTQTFPGRYDSLEKIAAFVRHEAENIDLPYADLFAVEAAVDEAVSNIIEHSYKGEDKGKIACTCISDADSFTVILEDYGIPFNPNSVPLPDLNVPLKQRKDHGLGFFLMHQWMDEVHFEFCQNCNRLVMVKRKEKKA